MADLELQSTQNSSISEQEVVRYLHAQPDFLLRHPELLTHIEIAHASGSAVSLIERQVDQLRGKNLKLEDRLAQLLQNAVDNEQRANHVHVLARTLIRAPSLAASIMGLKTVMRENFGIAETSVCVNASIYKRNDIEGLIPLEPDSALSKEFDNFLRTRLIECGPISPERASRVFGKTAQPILSAAIVPLEKEKHLGFLALGSADAQRFQNRQGHVFLEMTAELVSAAVRARLG